MFHVWTAEKCGLAIDERNLNIVLLVRRIDQISCRCRRRNCSVHVDPFAEERQSLAIIEVGPGLLVPLYLGQQLYRLAPGTISTFAVRTHFVQDFLRLGSI